MNEPTPLEELFAPNQAYILYNIKTEEVVKPKFMPNDYHIKKVIENYDSDLILSEHIFVQIDVDGMDFLDGVVTLVEVCNVVSAEDR